MIDAPEAAPASSIRDPEALSRKWQQLIELAERSQRDYQDEGKKVVDRYRNERKVAGKTRQRGLAILYGNTETLQADLYAKSAKPDVRRRFTDRDPVGQSAAEVIERTLTYFDDVGDVDVSIMAAIQDFLLPGRGVVRIEYEPVVGERPMMDPMTRLPIMETDDDGEPTGDVAMMQFIADQKIHHRYVYWRDFLHAPARSWADVSWLAFRHTMDRATIEDEIFDAPPGSKTYGKAADVPMNWTPDASDRRKIDDDLRKAEIWEIWDRASERRVWIVKGAPKPLRVDPDPYKLDGFFPLPEPIVAYRTNDSLIPIALYKSYEDQAEDLDEITRRISILTKALRRRGIYNQAIPELKRLVNAADNEYIASPNWDALSTKGGIAGNKIDDEIAPIAAVLVELYKQRDMLIQAIYEITGIADIMRGSTDPDETLGAQNLKAQFGSQRLKRMQRSIQRWVRDLNRIKTDLICQHFEPDVLSQITNMQVGPDIMAILRSDQMRSYRVDIETDSTVFQDATAQQQQRTAMVQGVVQLFEGMAPIVQQKPQLAPLLFELAAFALAPAPDSRQLQDALDEAQQAVMQAGPGTANPSQAAEQQALQAKAQAAQVDAQAKIQVAQIGAQAEAGKAQMETQRAALDLQAQRDRHAQDLAAAQQQHNIAMQQMAHKHALDIAARQHAARQQMLRGQTQ